MKKRQGLLASLLAGITATLIPYAPAWAQDDPTDDAARVSHASPPADNAAAKEIVVTAQRRAQNTLDVGINVSVLDGEALASRGVKSASELAGVAPNVTVKENIPGLLPIITIRGVGLNDFSSTNNPSAGVYVDEVPLSSLALMNFDFFDIDRIEALKGPQGTLYGRNSTAGALNVYTALPDFSEVSGRITGSISNYEAKELEGSINLPVSSSAALRLAAKVISQDRGFWFNRTTDRDVGERDLLLGRAQLRLRPADNVNIVLKVEGQRGRSELGQAEFFGALSAPGANCPGEPGCTDFFGYRDTDGDPFRGDWSIVPNYDYDQINLTGRAEVDLGFASLTSITSFIDFDRQWSSDTDATPTRQLDIYSNDEVEQFSQELRLAGETPVVDWLIGAFYTRDHVVTSYDGAFQDLFNTTTFTISDQITKSGALFANGEWRLTNALSLVTGLRYTFESKTNEGSTSDLVSLPPGSALTMAPFGSPPIPLATISGRITDENISYKLGLNWKPSPQTLVYLSASKGVKSGGFFAGVATSSAQLLPYRPETLYAYEAGVKGRLSVAGLSYGLSGFYYDYRDVQTFIRDVVGALPIQRLGNVDEAKIFGLDADIVFSPSFLPGLTATAGLGLLDTELGSFASSAGEVPAGNRLPDAPAISFNGGLSYDFTETSDLPVTLAVDTSYQSRTFRDALNDPILETSGYWIWNARASTRVHEGLDISVWAKNIFDERYVTQGVNQTVLGVGYRVYGAPRTYGATASFSF